MKKKNGQICCCIEFCDLNKACWKDELLLPNIDMLVDATIGNQCLSTALPPYSDESNPPKVGPLPHKIEWKQQKE